MKTLLKTFLVGWLAICTLDAKSSSSSFSSSSKPSSSSSFSSSPKPSSSNKSWSTTSQTNTRVGSKVEASRYQEAVKSGKAFTTRESAVADFKAKNASSFTNKFTSEPVKRPDYIPTNYTSGGKSYNIVYNQTSGGYGYWNGGGPGLGTWIMYDALSDMAMMNSLMARQNYYVGEPIVTESTHNPVLVWFGTIFAISLIVFLVAAFLTCK